MKDEPTHSKLVSEAEMLHEIFSEESSPCSRTVANWKKRRIIQYVKVGRKHFYNVPAVRAALASRFTVEAMGSARRV